MTDDKFNALTSVEKWETYETMKGTWLCRSCGVVLTDGPNRTPAFHGSSIHCKECDFELTRRHNGGQHEPFGWVLSMEHLNRLWGHNFYLCGPMDRVPDGGTTWRNELKPFLYDMGIMVFDPCNKPGLIGEDPALIIEDAEQRELRRQMKLAGDWDGVAASMRPVRNIDLDAVDNSTGLIVYWDTDVHLCGTMEEVFWGNRMKKPIMIVNKKGKVDMPDWMFAALPHRFFFNNFQELKEYLVHVDTAPEVETYNRWRFYDYRKLMPSNFEGKRWEE